MAKLNLVLTDVLMSCPALLLPMVLQCLKDTMLYTSLSARFEMDSHDAPVMIKIIIIVGIHKMMIKFNVKNNENHLFSKK